MQGTSNRVDASSGTHLWADRMNLEAANVTGGRTRFGACPGLRQMRQIGEEVQLPVAVERCELANARCLNRRRPGCFESGRIERLLAAAPREQPGAAGTFDVPIGPQDPEQLRRQHHVALLAALVPLASWMSMRELSMS